MFSRIYKEIVVEILGLVVLKRSYCFVFALQYGGMYEAHEITNHNSVI